jgi:GWxTD domain-containing protein
MRRLEKELPLEDKKFLSEVRYIITKQERKIFPNLPPSERKDFIKEFWKKRDPDPYTEENEFKEQYYEKIDEANRLFSRGRSEGWLRDRGRIHILLGPPDQKEVYPTGRTFYGPPMEIWYYGFFPVVFIDKFKDGDYRLDPSSARHISVINKAIEELKPKIEKEKVVLDFDLEIRKTDENEILIQVTIPYRNIWFSSQENRLETTLELSMEILDSSGDKIWEKQKICPLSIPEDGFYEVAGKNYFIEISVELEPGVYTLELDLENKTDNSHVKKKEKFKI